MKRVLAFLLLLGLGVLALWLAIGDEGAAAGGRPRAGQSGDRPATPPVPRTGAAIPIGDANFRATASVSGELELWKRRPVPTADGGADVHRVYRLLAKNSEGVREGLARLDDVTVAIFDKDEPAATITAATAFVELGADENGLPSLREDKDVDLRTVVLSTLPGTSLAGIRLELPAALVQVREAEGTIELRTPSEQDPVVLTMTGDRPGALRGRGLQARLPRDPDGAMRRADVEILHDPVLEADGMRVQAMGRLHYTEDTGSGTIQLTAIDDVTVDLQDGSLNLGTLGGRGSGAGGPSRARGDQMIGWLQRSRSQDANGRVREQMAWRQLQLHGAPADVTVPGLRLATPRVTVVPGLFGEPFLVTAAGGESRLEQTAPLRPSAKPKAGRAPDPFVAGTSQRRIHLVRPANQAGAFHRAFGFPQWTLGPLGSLQIAAFEGPSRLDAGSSAKAEADRGIELFAPDAEAEALAAIGRGAVAVFRAADAEQPRDLRASGNDGFRLVRGHDVETLLLGPRRDADGERWRDHRYELHYGDDRLRGLGTCEVERSANGTRLRLRAPDREIAGRLGGRVDVRSGRSLECEFGESDVRSLCIAGVPAVAEFAHGGRTFTGTAPRLEQIGPASLRLLPAPAAGAVGADDFAGLEPTDSLPRVQFAAAATPLHGRQRADLVAPRIDVHHLGGDDVAIDAEGLADRLAHVDAEIDPPGVTHATTIALDAVRLRLLPFAITPLALRAHTAGFAPVLGDVVGHGLASAWLRGDRVQHVEIRDATGTVTGHGHVLLLTEGGRAGLLVGCADTSTPARLEHAHDGRVVVASGARVRMLEGEGPRLLAMRTFPGRSTFVLPYVELHQPRASGTNQGLDHLEATCRGDIEVLPGVVLFHGPVTANSLLPGGATDPRGMHIEAEHLTMQRNRSGAVVRVLGQDVLLDWDRLRTRAADVELDLAWRRCRVRDPNDAEVTLADGRRFRAPFIEVFYETLAVRAVDARVDQVDRRPGSER